MIRLLLSLVGAYGVFLLYTSVALGWRGAGLAPPVTRRRLRRIVEQTQLQFNSGLAGIVWVNS